MHPRDIDAANYRGQRGLGDVFVESKGYKAIRDSASRGERWSSGPVEVSTKGTLLTTPGTALTPATYQPGVVETLFQQPSIADLMPTQLVDRSPVRYVIEGTSDVGEGVTNAADTVAEGSTKPESTLAFTEVTEPLSKIATVLPVSDEMLEDVVQLQATLNQRLSLFIRTAEDDQLLNGSGTPPDISGFLDRSISTWPRGTVDDNATAIFKAANGARGSSHLDCTAVILNPANWQAIRLAKDSAGQFYGGGPFYGPYGGPQGPAGASQFSADNLWGLPVVVTSTIGVGTALVGAFRTAATTFRRGGVSVEASNSHSTYFAENLTAIRAETRVGLGIFRPEAFCQVTGLA